MSRPSAALVLLSALALALSVTACYHATIETGLPPSNEVIKNSFASAWVYGLVPPKTIDTAAQCPNGVAKVETQLSFVNQLVGFLTLGIYTPMEITVTCAEGSGAELQEQGVDFQVSEGASPQDLQEVFAQAAESAMRSGRPVFVKLGP